MAGEHKNIHNALRQARIKLSSFSLEGFSISGLSTYLQVPELDFAVDMGECPLSAIPINHVFLTHAHGDHSRCLMRHHSLRKMTGISKDAIYYVPAEIVEKAKAWIKAEATFENVPDYKFRYPNIKSLEAGQRVHLTYRKDLALEAFSVEHSVPTMGCTLFRYKKKLKPEFLSATPNELIEKRNAGEIITNEVYEPVISFTGDCLASSLRNVSHLFDSEIIVTECTFLDDTDEEMAKQKSHSHINEIVRILNDLGNTAKCKCIILNHFSMKYTEKHILSVLEKKIPEAWKDKVKVLL